MYKVRCHWWTENYRVSITDSDGGAQDVNWVTYCSLVGEPEDAMRRLLRRYPGYQLETSGDVEHRIVTTDKAIATLLACDLFWLLNGAEVARDAQEYGQDLCEHLRAVLGRTRRFQQWLFIDGVMEYDYNPTVIELLCEIAEGAGTAESIRLEDERKSRAIQEVIDALDALPPPPAGRTLNH